MSLYKSSKSSSACLFCLFSLMICLINTAMPPIALGSDAKAAKADTPDKKTDKVEGWRQVRHNGLGREIIYADQNGVKIDYPDCNYTVLARPPSWDIIWFNSKNRQQFSDTLAHYRARKGLSADATPPASLKPTSTFYAGVNCRKFTVHTGPYVSYFYVTEPVDLPSGALVFLSTFFGMPNFGGIPLACHQALGKGQERKFWFTLSSERKFLPKSTFAPPVGYAKVANVDGVNMTAVNEQAEDVAKQMKIGVPFGQ